MPSRIRHYMLLFAATALLVISSTEAAQDPGQSSPVKQLSAPVPQTEVSEVKLLQRQLEDSKRFQDQMLTTIYWSLSTLGGVAVLLVGFGWFVNFRVYERDKASLERDLRAQMSEDAVAFSAKASEAAAANAEKLERLLSAKFASTEERINTRAKELLDGLEKKVAGRFATTDSELSNLKSAVLFLKRDALLRERHSWLDRKVKVPRNVLQQSVSALVIANEIGFEHDVGRILDLVSEDISAILAAKATPIDNFLVAQVIAALDAVKGGHAHAAATLKASASALLST